VMPHVGPLFFSTRNLGGERFDFESWFCLGESAKKHVATCCCLIIEDSMNLDVSPGREKELLGFGFFFHGRVLFL